MAIIPYFCLALAAAAFDDFSGPQKGEPLPECSIKVIIGPDKGKTVKYKEPLGDKAAVLIFVHEITRPSVGMSRSVINYAVKRKKRRLGINSRFPNGGSNGNTRLDEACQTRLTDRYQCWNFYRWN